LIWNATASTPIGLYRIDRTDTVAVGKFVGQPTRQIAALVNRCKLKREPNVDSDPSR
jgi:type IV secretory pathway protease TraF